MIREYVHQELNQEITAIGGHYVLTKEVRLPFRGREVLYLVGCAHALVPRFVLEWKSQTDEDSLAVSQVEPIRDEATQQEARRLIEIGEEGAVHQVTFQ